MAFDATLIAFSRYALKKGVSVEDMVSAKVVTTLHVVSGADAVAYDTTTKLIFCSNGDATTSFFK